ncbi:MAG: metal-dependent transcriptional regulator [Deltaproteobacteria bacterium]|nr:metal-dependent transcriptional regulator [Deltaproteobacteria bacterium]
MNPSSHDFLSSHLEDYLETIFHLQTQNRVARARDIAERLDVTRASVTGALKTLTEKGLVNHAPYSYVTLTKQGETIALEIIRRHETLKDFFEHFLYLDPEKADANACRVEHAVDSETIDRLLLFLEFLKKCPRTDKQWREELSKCGQQEVTPSRCQECLTNLLLRFESDN